MGQMFIISCLISLDLLHFCVYFEFNLNRTCGADPEIFYRVGGVKRLFDFAGGGGGLSHFFIFINKFNSARGVGGLGPPDPLPGPFSRFAHVEFGTISAFFQSHEIV